MSKKSPNLKKGMKESIAFGLDDPEPWINDLHTKFINDDEFQCSVSILVEAKPFYRQLGEEFDKFCQYGYRKCVKCVSVDKITEVIFTNCTKNGEMTPLACLCDEIMTHTGKFFNGKIPNNLFVYIIKYIILDYKEKCLKERQIAFQKELDYNNKLKSYQGAVDTKGKKGGTKETAKTTGKNAPQMLSEKINSQIHKRNENLKCLEDIHDEPLGGPQLYILIIQSQNFELPIELIKSGIPLTSIIQIGNLDTATFDDEDSLKDDLSENRIINHKIENILKHSFLDKTDFNRSFVRENDIRSYWSKIILYMSRKKYSGNLINVDIRKYLPEISENPKSPKFIDEVRKSVYNGISSVMFDSYTLRRSHKEVHVGTAVITNVFSDIVPELADLKFYKNVMDRLPQLSASVALVLDTLVSQVCRDDDSYIGYDEEKFKFLLQDQSSQSSEEFQKDETCMEQLIKLMKNKYNMSLTDRKSASSIVDTKNHIDDDKDEVKVFFQGDTLAEMSSNFNKDITNFVQSRTLYVQQLFWDNVIWFKLQCKNRLREEYKHFINCNLEDSSQSELLEVLFSLFQINNENPREESQKVYVYYDSTGDLNEYTDDLIKKMSDQPLVKDYMPDNLSILEPIQSKIIFSKFENNFMDSSHFKAQYVSMIDKLIVQFYSKDIPVKKNVELPTVLSLRDYIHETSQEKTRLNINQLFEEKKRFNYSEMVDGEENMTSVQNYNEDSTVQCKQTKYFDGNDEEWIISMYDTVVDNRCKYKYLLTDKQINNKGIEKVNSPQEPLYDIGVDGKIRFNFFDMHIKLNKKIDVSLVYWDVNYQEKFELMVSAKIQNHEFHYSTNIIPESFTIEPTDKRKSIFFTQHSSGMRFSFRKISGKYNDPQKSDFPDLLLYTFFKGEDLSKIDFLKDKSYRFELNVSLPSGLTVQQINTPDWPLYIKQKYLHDIPNAQKYDLKEELYRCYINDGTVIKFMKNGYLIIMGANGKLINCARFEQNVKQDDSQMDTKNKQNLDLVNGNKMGLKMSEYEVRLSDGLMYSVNDDQVTNNEPLYVQDFHGILEGIITTEFSDGLLYEHRSDNSLTVHFLDGTRIISYARFCQDEITIDLNGPDDESNSGSQKSTKESPSETKESPIETNGSLSEYVSEPFTTIEITYKIHHPCFATTVFSFCGTTSQIILPERTQIKFSNDIDISFNEEIIIFNSKTAVIVRELIKEKVHNEIVFSFEDFKARDDIKRIPCVVATDSFNNSLIVYDNGKFQVNSQTCEDEIQNERKFIIDRDYSGFEIFSKFQMNQNLIELQRNNGSVVRQRKKGPFIDHLGFLPIIDMDKWSMNFDCTKKETILEMPSTYGNSWAFPFRNDGNGKNIMDGVRLKLFKEIYSFEDSVEEMKCLLEAFNADEHFLRAPEESNTSLNFNFIELFQPINKLLVPETVLNLYNKGTFKLESECERRDSKMYIQKKVIISATIRSIYRVFIDKIVERFQEEKKDLFNRKIRPYFENAEGAIFTIMTELIERIQKINEDKKNRDELENLLNKSLHCVNEGDLGKIKDLLVKMNSKFDKGESLDKILNAGKNLENYFTNMNEVLNFHEMMTTEKMNIKKSSC